ncbi:MAG TPA: type II secretion system minor pseudopilin GspI [Burkholderiaceae bacterium]|nr:type II secretion system minor pseudopilin GspI [Burkholderiaceae bacterium]
MTAASERARARRAGGFTLIEVLVALTIVAIALMAALQATGALADSASQLRQRTLAQWSAENRLAQIRIQRGALPPLGRRTFDCSQADAVLVCTEEVFATPNAMFRRVEISVHAAESRHRLARLVGFAAALPQ